MKKIACVVVLMTAVCTYAADQKELSIVEEFFRVAKVKEKYEVGMIAGFEAGSGMQDLSSLSEEQKKKIKDMQEKIKTLMLEEMGWDKVKSDYAELYLSVYDVTELKEITKMLKTPIGQKMVNNEIKLIPEAMKIGQDKAKKLMPKIIQISTETMMSQ